MKFLLVDGTGIAVMCNKVGGVKVEEANARRIASLWNAAEDLDLTTEKIAEGEIQRTFTLAESRAGVIEAALERIEKIEAEKAEILAALEAGRKFIANGIDLGYIRICMPESGDPALETPGIIDAAIRKARGEEA